MKKQMEIKCNGWHKVELEGNLMTGDTFKVKEFIKKYLGGHWDGKNKGWIVDLAKVAKYTRENGITIMVI